MQLDRFQIQEQSSLRDALAKIENNHLGLIFALDKNGAVSGLATDGDIRRKLLEGALLEDTIASCINADFLWENHDISRESLIKKLDNRIRVIPLLDENRYLVDIVSRDHIPSVSEDALITRARAPVRISFGGGGSDLTHFFNDENGAVINTTISIYSHATMRLRDDNKIIVKSFDLGETLKADNLDAALNWNGQFMLMKALLKAVRPDFGFELEVKSDFPMKSGLGGSSVVSAAILGCFNQFRRDSWNLHEIAELAFQAERLHMGIQGGWQDQYATVFGGFNFMEFRARENIVHPLRIHQNTLLELEECLVLCDTGTKHESGDIHADQEVQMQEEKIRQQIRANIELSYQMRNRLLRGKLSDFGQLLDKAWQYKRQFSTKISNSYLDNIYEDARKHGALGGKLMGAGGGGFFIFYVPPFYRNELQEHLIARGLKIQPFRFESNGLQTWQVRQPQNKSA
ncbi:CBS domain-containing protein [Lentilitoribacter sp. Alg239-R112]|uniref:GHMP family kinase ATP-binding protein n=1 Tax=Lentilitoribacter sp. Alg239-R112 TaxID=2305987 RepID=UPI0013A70314|nr:CBS domain-containing protein [Lentilitoribacter sp. Alg239-R112]